MERLTSTAILPDTFQGAGDDISMQIGLIWGQVKAPLIVPLLQVAVFLCLVMSVMLFVERVYMSIVIVLLKLFGRKPDKRYKWEAMKDDVELGNSAYPMVLLQIPMFNEREVLFFPLLWSKTLQTLLLFICFTQSLCKFSFCHYLYVSMQVYQLSIGAACGLSWPSDRIIIQVLDDSTDPTIKVPNQNNNKKEKNHFTLQSKHFIFFKKK